MKPCTNWLTLGIQPREEGATDPSKDTNGERKGVGGKGRDESGKAKIARLNDGIERMRINWNSIIREEKGDSSKQPHAKWLTLGIGPSRSDEVAVEEKMCDFDSCGLHANKLMEYTNGMKQSKNSSICSCRKDGSNKEVKDTKVPISLVNFPEDILIIILSKVPLPTLCQSQFVSNSL